MEATTEYLKPQVMVVDDMEEIRDILGDLLGDDGYPVLKADGGREGLREAHAGLGVILLDVMMPDLDGLRVCQDLKKNPQTARVPVLFLSSFVDFGMERLAREAGATDFLTKPVSASELRAKVSAAASVDRSLSPGAFQKAYQEQVEHGLFVQAREDAEMDRRWASLGLAALSASEAAG